MAHGPLAAGYHPQIIKAIMPTSASSPERRRKFSTRSWKNKGGRSLRSSVDEPNKFTPFSLPVKVKKKLASPNQKSSNSRGSRKVDPTSTSFDFDDSKDSSSSSSPQKRTLRSSVDESNKFSPVSLPVKVKNKLQKSSPGSFRKKEGSGEKEESSSKTRGGKGASPNQKSSNSRGSGKVDPTSSSFDFDDSKDSSSVSRRTLRSSVDEPNKFTPFSLPVKVKNKLQKSSPEGGGEKAEPPSKTRGGKGASPNQKSSNSRGSGKVDPTSSSFDFNDSEDSASGSSPQKESQGRRSLRSSVSMSNEFTPFSLPVKVKKKLQKSSPGSPSKTRGGKGASPNKKSSHSRGSAKVKPTSNSFDFDDSEDSSSGSSPQKESPRKESGKKSSPSGWTIPKKRQLEVLERKDTLDKSPSKPAERKGSTSPSKRSRWGPRLRHDSDAGEEQPAKLQKHTPVNHAPLDKSADYTQDTATPTHTTGTPEASIDNAPKEKCADNTQDATTATSAKGTANAESDMDISDTDSHKSKSTEKHHDEETFNSGDDTNAPDCHEENARKTERERALAFLRATRAGRKKAPVENEPESPGKGGAESKAKASHSKKTENKGLEQGEAPSKKDSNDTVAERWRRRNEKRRIEEEKNSKPEDSDASKVVDLTSNDDNPLDRKKASSKSSKQIESQDSDDMEVESAQNASKTSNVDSPTNKRKAGPPTKKDLAEESPDGQRGIDDTPRWEVVKVSDTRVAMKYVAGRNLFGRESDENDSDAAASDEKAEQMRRNEILGVGVNRIKIKPLRELRTAGSIGHKVVGKLLVQYGLAEEREEVYVIEEKSSLDEEEIQVNKIPAPIPSVPECVHPDSSRKDEASNNESEGSNSSSTQVLIHDVDIPTQYEYRRPGPSKTPILAPLNFEEKGKPYQVTIVLHNTRDKVHCDISKSNLEITHVQPLADPRLKPGFRLLGFSSFAEFVKHHQMGQYPMAITFYDPMPEALRHIPLNEKIEVINRKTGKLMSEAEGIKMKDLPALLRMNAYLEPIVPPPPSSVSGSNR